MPARLLSLPLPHLARIVLVALLLALPSAVSATTVVRQSLDSLTDTSDLVVRGTVERVEFRAPEGGPPFTLAFVRVADAAAGMAPAVVPVRLPGGMTASGLDVAVAGTPRLATGDDVFLFLTRVPGQATARPTRAPASPGRARAVVGGEQPAAQWQPIGLSLGTWRVVEGSAGPEVVRDPSSRGLHQVGEARDPLPERVPLSALSQRVRERKAGR